MSPSTTKHIPTNTNSYYPSLPHPLHSLYTSALTNLLQRQPKLAISECLKALNLTPCPPPEIKDSLWVIYVTASKELKVRETEDEIERVTETWDRVVDGYGGIPGDVEAKVVVACILFCLHRKLVDQARSIAESWIATLTEETVRCLEERRDDEIRTGYERVVELYLLHVLARMEDWDGAREFLKWNGMLTEEKKKNYQIYIERLYRKSRRRQSAPPVDPSPPLTQTGSDDRVVNSSSSSVIKSSPIPVEKSSIEKPITTEIPFSSLASTLPTHEKQPISPELRLQKFLRLLVACRSTFSILAFIIALIFASKRNERLRFVLLRTWSKLVGTVKMGTSLSTL